MNVGILLFDDVEVLDFAGPFEVFSTASRLALRQQPNTPVPLTVITSAGISAGIDMSLHLVSRLAGRDLASRTARQMEFNTQAASHGHRNSPSITGRPAH